MKRTRTGLRAAPFILAFAWAGGCAAAPLEEKEKSGAAYSVVAGSVFRDPGFALPSAEVLLTLEPGQSSSLKVKKMTFVTNTRGEFAFRVPSAVARYRIAVSAKGLKKQEKTIEVQPADRIDVTFTLVPESNE